MQKLLTFLLVCAVMTSSGQVAIKNTELLPAVGSWEGELSYLDYSSGQQTVIPATVDLEQIRTGVFTLTHRFPKEPQVKWTDTIAISADGLFWGKERLVANETLAGGGLSFITEEEGKDDKKPARLRRTYVFSPEQISIKKEVRFADATTWITRHQYRYTIRARWLTPQQMKADLQVLKTTWETIHPGLYRYNTPEQINTYFRDLDAKINAPMEQRRFFILISQLNIRLGCGHSFVSYYNNKRLLKNNLYSRVFIPVLFRVMGGKYIITHNLTEEAGIRPGDEIVAVNGIRTGIITDSLLTVSKADGRNGLNKKLDNITLHPRDINTDRYSLFDIFFPLFFKKDLHEPVFTLEIRSAGGSKKIWRVNGLSKEVREQTYIQRYGELPKNEQSWYVKPIDANTVLFRLGDFTTFNWKFDFNKYLDSIFTGFRQKGYKNLIVDIRGNEGGADEARDAVLSYLTPRNLGCANPYRRLYRYNKIPDSLHQYLDTWDNGFRKPKPDSLYRKTADGFYESRFPGQCDKILSKPEFFRGNIYLITDVTNSSATFIMADVFKTNKLGTIVGEKTGGSQQGINGGELFFFYLPYSKIEMDLPLIYQAPQTSRPDDGIQPDYTIITTGADLAKGRDPQLQFILQKLIKTR